MADLEKLKEEGLTKEKAIELGWTHFCEEGGDRLLELKNVNDGNKSQFDIIDCYLVDMNNPKHYKIDAETIRNLIFEHINEDDSIADEDEKLSKIAYDHDYSTVAEGLNEKFKAIDYYYPTDIKVTFNTVEREY